MERVCVWKAEINCSERWYPVGRVLASAPKILRLFINYEKLNYPRGRGWREWGSCEAINFRSLRTRDVGYLWCVYVKFLHATNKKFCGHPISSSFNNTCPPGIRPEAFPCPVFCPVHFGRIKNSKLRPPENWETKFHPDNSDIK